MTRESNKVFWENVKNSQDMLENYKTFHTKKSRIYENAKKIIKVGIFQQIYEQDVPFFLQES